MLRLAASDGRLLMPEEEEQSRPLSDATAANELIEKVNELHDRLADGSNLRVLLAAFGASLEQHRASGD